MNEGVYTLSRFLVLREKASIIFEHRDLLSFEVTNPGENRLGWIGRRKEGVVRPVFDWSIRAAEHDPTTANEV